MKHILVNKNSQTHAVIMECPFKYTAPRAMTVYHDINHDFSHPFNPTGKSLVDVYTHVKPKNQDNVNADAINFAIIRDGIIEGCIVWGGAEWLPPFGTLMIPLEKWMGVNDFYNEDQSNFTMCKNRIGKKDSDKTVQELEQEAQNGIDQLNAKNAQDNLGV